MLRRQNSKSLAGSSRGASASASGPSQPQKGTVRYHDEEQNLTYSIELALSYERVSSVSESSPSSSSSSDMHSKNKFLPSREYDLSLSVEILSWNYEALYARAFSNESWEAEVVFLELQDGKFQFMDYGNYVQVSILSGGVLLQIPKVDREPQRARHRKWKN